MVPKFFVGVDISKLTLDIAVLTALNAPSTFKIQNTEAAISEFIRFLKTEYNFKAQQVCFCAEHMGIYAIFLLAVLQKKKIPVYLESPLQIKRSLGIQRGKNDRLDAIRIAQYAKKNYMSMTLWEPERDCVRHLRFFFNLRKKLTKAKVILINDSKVKDYYLSSAEKVMADSYHIKSLTAIRQDIKQVETKMLEVIQQDEKLSGLLKIITSIPHVGKIISIQVIIYTNEFKDITSAKKFASYCGIAPFEWSSGSSLLGKSKVSHLANKELKTALHLASMGYTRRKETFLGKYYIRKVAEGKNKMSILNAIRNKLVHRIFSCVNSGKMYVDKGH